MNMHPCENLHHLELQAGNKLYSASIHDFKTRVSLQLGIDLNGELAYTKSK